MVSKKTAWLVLGLILTLAASLRLSGLTIIPPSLNWDEVSHAYNAYSLLHSGFDQWGQIPLLNFRAYGDYPTTLNLYLTVPAIAILGPTDFAVRFPHALIGTLSVLVAYIAVHRWLHSRQAGLLAALIFALSPWTLFLSRQVLQSNWSVFLLTLGLALFLSKKYFLSLLMWGLTLFAYHNTRVFTPLLLIAFLLNQRFKFDKKILIAAFSFIVLGFGILWFSESRARGSWVSILDSGAIAYLEEQRNKSQLPEIITMILYNRPVYVFSKMTQNYLGYFSPQYLFFTGGTQYQFSLPGFGLLAISLLPFFYLGIVQLIQKRQHLMLVWLLLSPLPAVITRDQFAVVRSTTMIPAVLLTIVLGLISIPKLQKLIIGSSVIGILFSTIIYSQELFTSYPKVYSQSWQYGNHQLIEYLETVYDHYDTIFLTKRYGEPHEYLFWYWPISPQRLHLAQNFEYDFHDNWYWVNKFEKIEFVNDWEMLARARGIPPGTKALLVSSPEAIPPSAQIHQINFLDGTPAYIVSAI